MQRILTLVATLAFVFGVVVPVVAADQVLSGTLVCAYCTLKKADAHECQDVLLVSDARGDKTEYYVTRNEVAAQSGEACTLEIKATVTGQVSEKDGRKWITPTKIQKHQ